ncbi:thiamine phosphate synthase [Streptomyces sp. 4N509B]|uniref:thiamine phosphate synthase n=1 Tax=Streptomyces sp. 4N509B TaxID=3457413 RepID=UPI003FD27537
MTGPGGRAELARALSRARLYLCTDARKRQGDLPEFLDAVLAGGVDVVQLREKGMEAAEELEHLAVFAAACRRHGALLAVNDRADVAHAAAQAATRAAAHAVGPAAVATGPGAPGPGVLHLGQGDLPVTAARAILGERVLIGRSTHSEAQVEDALADPGVDYFCVGPCWPTPTKPGRAAPGLPLVRHAAARAAGGDRPWFAIGGVDERRLEEVLAAGARRVVVVRAITEADDPGAAASRLAGRLREVPLPSPRAE